jgi:two-component system, cell cycle response regulator
MTSGSIGHVYDATPPGDGTATRTSGSVLGVAASVTASPLQAVAALRLVVRGFNPMERGLLEGTVRLSQRRNPPLYLLADTDVAKADVVMVDARDAQAMQWARTQPLLMNKVVIWVDSGATSAPGHSVVRRPVQWPSLPMILARAMEQASVKATPAPVQPSPVVHEVRSAELAAPANHSRPVLIVDDSLAVRAYLRSQLEGRGLRVSEAESAQAAIEIVQRTAFSAVLMDVLMPGIDGYEGCKQIKSRLRGVANVAVIMLTSKSSPFDRIRGKMAGCDAYLTKPVDPKQLQEVLDQHVLRSGTPATQATPAQAPAAPLTTPSRGFFFNRS